MKLFYRSHLIGSWLSLRLRTRYWQRVLKMFGTGSVVLGRISVVGADKIYIGNRTTLNEGVLLNAQAPMHIGSHVALSPGAMLLTGGLVFVGEARTHRPHQHKPITIHDGAWVGAGAIILGGITVGEDAIVAAGAVVTEDVPPGTLVAGVPARVVKQFSVPEARA